MHAREWRGDRGELAVLPLGHPLIVHYLSLGALDTSLLASSSMPVLLDEAYAWVRRDPTRKKRSKRRRRKGAR
eukprot:5956723-Amphidinium_carterae.2